MDALRSLPCVSTVTQTLTTLNIGAVTEQLEKAAYFPLLMSGGPHLGGPRTAAEPRRYVIDTELTNDGLVPHNQISVPAAVAEFGWRILPTGREGEPRDPSLTPGVAQPFEIFDFRLNFNGSESGFTAYGAGQTLPGAGSRPGSVGVAFVLDVQEGFGQFQGLAGTVTASGDLIPGHGGAGGSLELVLMVRMADPAGQLLASGPLVPYGPGFGVPTPAATYMAFLGEVDPSHPVTLRFSLTEGLLGSNVFELLRTARLDFSTTPGPTPGLKALATTGAIAGSVSAELNFDPLALAPNTPITTQNGVFEFHDRLGNRLGCVYADMTAGRSFRTSLEGVLLPVFRFGGFGPLRGGTGAFAGARGIMLLNAVISVQPRTLSNLYLFRFAHPTGPVVTSPRRIA